MQRSVVDFPHPDGPSSVKNAPDSTSNVTSCTAWTGPWSVSNILLRFLTWSATATAPPSSDG